MTGTFPNNWGCSTELPTKKDHTSGALSFQTAVTLLDHWVVVGMDLIPYKQNFLFICYLVLYGAALNRHKDKYFPWQAGIKTGKTVKCSEYFFSWLCYHLGRKTEANICLDTVAFRKVVFKMKSECDAHSRAASSVCIATAGFTYVILIHLLKLLRAMLITAVYKSFKLINMGMTYTSKTG